MEFYEKLVRQEPENAFALKGLGDIYADMYEFRNALEYYEKLVKVDSNTFIESYFIANVTSFPSSIVKFGIPASIATRRHAVRGSIKCTPPRPGNTH